MNRDGKHGVCPDAEGEEAGGEKPECGVHQKRMGDEARGEADVCLRGDILHLTGDVLVAQAMETPCRRMTVPRKNIEHHGQRKHDQSRDGNRARLG